MIGYGILSAMLTAIRPHLKPITAGILAFFLLTGAWKFFFGPGWYYLRVVWTVDRILKQQNHGQEYIR